MKNKKIEAPLYTAIIPTPGRCRQCIFCKKDIKMCRYYRLKKVNGRKVEDIMIKNINSKPKWCKVTKTTVEEKV